MSEARAGGRRLAIVQSSYIPWKGFFDLIASVDELVLLDDVQFTRRDWRNRNRIKGPAGPAWLTIPVHSRGRYTQRIDETEIVDPAWAERHWATLRHAYGAAPCFEAVAGDVQRLYEEATSPMLTEVNERMLRSLCGMLGITTAISRSDGVALGAGRTERLVEICRAAGATTYLSGPTARDYLDEEAFARAGVEVEWMQYGPYPEYPQVHGPFEHHVTVLDVLLHTGPEAAAYVRGAHPVEAQAV